MLHFRLLGPLGIILPDGRELMPSSSKICKVLALLLLRNELTSVDLLIRELWGDSPPKSALTTLQTYIYHTRRMFDREIADERDAPQLVTRPPGYELRIDSDQVDAKVFERLINEGRVLLDRGETEEAATRLRKALGLWNGPALANITGGDVLRGHIIHLEELRIRALELRMAADKRMGRRRDLIPELRAMVVAYPLNEWFHLQLINELHHSGRRAEALQAYQDLRGILAEELGLEPSAEVQRLQGEVLRSDSLDMSRLLDEHPADLRVFSP